MANYIILNIIISKVFKMLRLLMFIALVMLWSSCSKLVEVDPPYTNINKDNVFNNDATASATLTHIYGIFSTYNQVTDVSVSTLYAYAGLLADELTLFNKSLSTYNTFYTNSLNADISTGVWSLNYSIIFAANSAIEGLSSNQLLTKSTQQQLLGEAKFVRAFCYFYLVNLYGKVPLVISTDPLVNQILGRQDVDKIYSQMIADLSDAEELLSEDFRSGNVSISTDQRVRPSKWAAKALLSRVYLYHKDYLLSEQLATEVINESSLFQLDSLDNVFLINSKESIWQLQNVFNTQGNTGEGNLFILPSGGPNSSKYPIYLSHHVVESFEEGDQRKTHWTDTVMDKSGNVYYYAKKYKSGAQTSPGQNSEYETVFRLGEQYLIRAEARVQLNRFEEGKSDLNTIRKRAGLSNFMNLTKDSLLEAILHERQVELFTEWGHRWFDLRRMGKINEVMQSVTSEKGGTWSENWAYWPLSKSELVADYNLVQNIGY
ncbi:RagB/SusD family nutrient uptake outer membrane protein [Chitinophaga sancti]|uniref:RagB/SusD domain-containing protein n=1 Tax=Chitinophaga sancti TaxID=1004 RepID=A0A1K1T282_9BACT|nr:RagB/SusD family nutrient uptake outer membrane protein [Chitinophaga sancti]WQD59577.1 RagB/SusD family nutrient uptake outer membrane protein [Chitinophaga sancti]WQG88289.1 RagB/SusD family nutrient uptake outer membrane protein [Chitinophaga sancti]SFW90696.1 RagB/SusD domain-containing protein [Chitinophaga sancti]